MGYALKKTGGSECMRMSLDDEHASLWCSSFDHIRSCPA